MNPFTLTAWFLIAAIAAAVIPYIIGKRALARSVREVAKNPPLFAPSPEPSNVVFGKRKHTPSIFLTARQLERVNIVRKAAGYNRLNGAGFVNAVACAWGGGRKSTLGPQPGDANEWLAYLILYECLNIHHVSDRDDVGTGLTITPDLPYNGQQGSVARGTGVSGDWQRPDASTAAAAAAIAIGAAILTPGEGPDTGWDQVEPGFGPTGAARPRPSGYDPGLALMAHPSADRDGPIFEFVDDHALNPTMPDADR